MPSKIDDVAKIAMDAAEEINVLQQDVAVVKERVGVLERSAHSMAQLPQTVAMLGQRVDSLDTTVTREVNGLREQQKAHKNEMTHSMDIGFKALTEKMDAVNHMRNVQQKSWWQVIQTVGQILVGLAVIAEAVKAIIH